MALKILPPPTSGNHWIHKTTINGEMKLYVCIIVELLDSSCCKDLDIADERSLALPKFCSHPFPTQPCMEL